MESSVKTLAIKVYEEQMPHGLQAVIDAIKSADKRIYQVIAIKHDRDYVGDDFFAPSLEKAHYHIIVRINDKSPRKVRTILNLLYIVFRPSVDDVLRDQHGLETIRDFTNYTVYLLHKTEQAINDGKSMYEANEFISNLTPDEITQIMDGYTKVSTTKSRVTLAELIELDKTAYQLGYDLKDFFGWYGSLPFLVRSHSKMRTIEESYYRGVRVRVTTNNKINRLCIYIQGEPDDGKTYASLNALSGKQVLTIEGGCTGKFDNLQPSTDAIVVSDDTVPYLLNLADNYMCQVYRRNRNNPYWCGNYLIVTGNLSFEEWVKSCGIKSQKHIDALISRFYICHIEKSFGNKILFCDSPSTRGMAETQAERLERFIIFCERFNETIANYIPSKNLVDYSAITFLSELKEIAEEEYRQFQQYQQMLIRETHFANQEIYAEYEAEKRMQDDKSGNNQALKNTSLASNHDPRIDAIRRNGYILEFKEQPALYYTARK